MVRTQLDQKYIYIYRTTTNTSVRHWVPRGMQHLDLLGLAKLIITRALTTII